MHDPGRARRWLLGALAAGVLMFLFFGSRLTVASKTPLTGCITQHGTGGGLGFARWARKLGYNLHGLEVPAWEAATALAQPRGNCLLSIGNGEWAPIKDELTIERWQALRRWLADGNTLIVVTADPATLPKTLRDDIFAPVMRSNAVADVLRMVFKPVGGEKGSEPDALPFVFAPTVPADPELVDVPALGLGSLSVQKAGQRGLIPSNQLWERAPDGRPDPSGAAARRWQWVADDQGGILYRIPIDRGAVYLLLDDYAWTNAGLDHGENAKVLAGILASQVQGGVIAVDEYRHGHGRAESFLTFLLSLPGARSALWLAGLWCLLYFYGRNVRLQPLTAYQQIERRTAREYIDAVAQLHARARAAPLAVEAVARRFRHLLRGPAEPATPAADLLRSSENYVTEGTRPPQPTRAMKLVNDLIRLRKQLYGSRTIS